jgi:signal transduction histidine kinase
MGSDIECSKGNILQRKKLWLVEGLMFSLRVRLLLFFSIVVLVALGTVAVLVSRATTTEFERSIAGIINYRYFDIRLKAEQIQNNLYQFAGERDLWEKLQALLERISSNSRTRIVMADLEGRVYADSSEKLIGETLNTTLSKPFAAFLIEGIPILAYAEPIDTPQLELAQQQFTSSVNRSLFLAIFAASIVAIALTLATSKSILRPVETLIAAARKMEKGDLSQRVNIRSKGELGELANAFNAMADGLERLEQLRRNMTSDVAHELRTPLSNIRGYLEAIQDGMVEPTPELIVSLHEEALLLSQLVDDLQELALAEAGQIELKREPVPLPELIERTITALLPLIQEKKLQVRTEFSPQLEPVNADHRRVSQVLRNLLTNAIRYTPTGGTITISARCQGDKVEVSVQDSGIGIDPDHLPFLFERFYRVDQSRTRSTGGAGLGLAIVKQLVQAQGGEVNVASQVGAGTTFIFTLPSANGAAAG